LRRIENTISDTNLPEATTAVAVAGAVAVAVAVAA